MPPWPLEPRVNTEIRRPTRALELEPERTTGCKSMRGPRPASGTPPDCSGETCSLSEETKAPQQQQLVPPATRHDTAEGACPHSRRPCKQWGCPLSSVTHSLVEDEINDPMKNRFGQVCRDRRSKVTYVGPPGGSSRAVLSSQVHFGSRGSWSIEVVEGASPFL